MYLTHFVGSASDILHLRRRMNEPQPLFRLLLTVEDTFEIETRGLVLTPDFSVPKSIERNQWIETIDVHLPNGDRSLRVAHFTMSHFLITDPTVPMDRRWRIVITLPGATKEELPIGSRVFARAELVELLIRPKR